MGKKTRKRGRGDNDNPAAWSASDHDDRKARRQFKKVSQDKLEQREQRTALLTRGSKEKQESGKLRLHIKLVKRQIDKLRERLTAWDDQEEARLAKRKEEEERKRQQELENPTKEKKGRKGPETWKLKGAARPAHEVYDFDTRYVCPHMKAHEDHKQKVARSRNIFVLGKGRFGALNDEEIPQPFCRDFLGLLMQLGNLSVQSNQLKSARATFIECMDLDSFTRPVTPARCQLMCLYLDNNRPESARRLWEKLSPDDPSVWIRYSAALIEYVSWKLLEEEGSTKATAEELLTRAIKTNVFCAYYLAFFDSFDEIMEHVEEIEGASEESPLEEAIEYCNSEQMGAWQGTDGACEWIRSFLKKAIKNDNDASSSEKITKSDLDWRVHLDRVREEAAAINDNAKIEGDGDGSFQDEDQGDDEEDEETVVDVAMFGGMFETAMEMLEDEGGLS